MEKISPINKNRLMLKFIALYIISITIIIFCFTLFWPHTTQGVTITEAKTADAGNKPPTEDLLKKIEYLSNEYRNLKKFDQDYPANTTLGSGANTQALTVENNINSTLDSLAKAARSSSDIKQALQLQNFIETFRQALADRSAMNAYKAAILTSGDKQKIQQTILKLQTDVTSKNNQILTLETQIQTLVSKKSKTAGSGGAENLQESQQLEVLKTTISSQEKKIASLTATNAALEKEKTAEAETAKNVANNTNNALKNQNALLEKRINELNADLQLTLAECSITRADASQIISSSKQRKALLSDALGKLNNLATNNDANIKTKVADKLARLNKVASTMHD